MTYLLKVVKFDQLKQSKIMAILSESIVGKDITVTIKSSNINEAKYDTESKILQIKFNNNTIYEYEDVPWETFTKLRMAESQGSFFSKNISKTYKYKKVNESV